MTVIDDPVGIRLYRFATMIQGLKLETKGLKSSRGSMYAALKQERGYKGNKEKVLAQAQADYDKEKKAYTDSKQNPA